MNNFRDESKDKLDNICIVYPKEVEDYINRMKSLRKPNPKTKPNNEKSGPPKSPPPNMTPQSPKGPDTGLKAVDPGAIRPCLYRLSYIWPKKGKPFWAYLVYAGRKSVSRWKYYNGRWIYFGMDLKNIESFICY
ncbi:hypothetical protein [Clostridium sp. DL1XJH146]